MTVTRAWTALSLLALGACTESARGAAPEAAHTAAPVVAAAQPKAGPSGETPPSAPPPASEPAADPAPEPAPEAPDSISKGEPNDGTLIHGAILPLETDAVRFNSYRKSTARYATQEVMAAIVRAAEVVHEQMPGGRLTVNDLSLEGGGPIPHHGSHRSGRDADILFYLLDDDGKPFESVGAPLDPRGYGHDYKDLSIREDDIRLHLDAPRTWRFVQALIEDDAVPLQRIFVVEHIRTLLLAEAKRQKAPEEVIARFAAVTCQPGFPHDDHMHMRWFCDPGDIPLGCYDMPPVYPWHEAWLAERDSEVVMAPPRRQGPPRPKSKVVSHKEARSKAERRSGGLHPDVKAFLERRKAWLPDPHPGRRWCR